MLARYTIGKVRDGETVIIDGKRIRKHPDRDTVQVGDLYIAGRNGEAILATVLEIHPRNWIVATDPTIYKYDTWECFPVVLVDEDVETCEQSLS